MNVTDIRIAERIAQLVAEAPPLTTEQRTKIAALINSN